MNLEQEALKLLKEDGRPREQIAVGAGISYSWITKFSAGSFTSAGIKTVQKLYDYLTKSSAISNPAKPRKGRVRTHRV